MISSELSPLIQSLARPSIYPAEAWGDLPLCQRHVELIETHISVIALTARRAYKLKKPLRFWDLLDYSSLELRRHYCEEEVRLNRRLAPDLYLGVTELATPSGPEASVVMRRFDPATSLMVQLEEGRAGAPELQAVGQRIAAFHADHPLVAAKPAALLRSFARFVHSNLRATRGSGEALIPEAVHRLLDQRLAMALRRQRRLLLSRLEGGWAVDGHGDLRLEHVLMDGPIAVIDCVEFNAELRHIDGGSDLAFLVMELQANGQADLIAPLLEGYSRTIEPAVLALFCAYRAHVRAKVAVVSGREARGQLSLALAYASSSQAAPALILLRGCSGSGKSHLAAELAPWLLAEHLGSDRIRKQLHGLQPQQRTSGRERERLYSAEANRRTEASLLENARLSLERGQAVLLDATHLRQDSRQHAIALAEQQRSPWLILNLHTPQGLIEQRLKQRQLRDDDPSDADGPIQAAQRAYSQPLTAAESERTINYHFRYHPNRPNPPEDQATAPVITDPFALLMEIWTRLAAAGGSSGRPLRLSARR
ncbi:AAA family ATPase [Synechococcus sp. CS-602]|uniref:bifunctional aminoglycoside phosphotransferase/ATP-binding protein n=1 Tax=Synechococcaceae TaxID=1890426 RepID=UPI0008FF1470|nr:MULTISPECIES: bifunctional aminoglycoside phosphotransferase/ATP-binding protein [Synechococcaceae]MCT4365787.1 AAA family ATPase [Candidatus Regnicoccus frigidus MAG-AL1]APD49070.1 hypothetical protein BM449_13505 [Synechococcus sp. SynAce01]MCT0201026.1 AAA family ATPase [Synechococcus sp. CS-603]MCT0205551.1 AAA family ATPase [Synechococcus sp. CS-602]MCT0246912.1 AAA family ATPase [Synechococcus sp. CS-601]